MTSHNKARNGNPLSIDGIEGKDGWNPNKHEAQKTKVDWLRSEIAKLENVIRDFIARWEHPDSELPIEHTVKSETIYHLNSIITRYKEELLELDSKEV